MKRYANLHRDSGVEKYLIAPTSIKFKFNNNTKIYVYNYTKPGKNHVQQMKKLALTGRGLATYVSQNIKKNYHSVE